MTSLDSQQRQALRYADEIVIDLSDTTIKGNAVYGTYFIAWDRLKKGKFSDALGMLVKGTKLYLMSHTKPRNDGLEKEVSLLGELYNLLGDHKVTKKEMQKATRRYVNSRLFKRKGFGNCLEKMRKYGKPKKVYLITGESVESTEAVRDCYNFVEKSISNITKFGPDETINGLDCVMKKPEDRPIALEKAIGDLKKTVLISNNDSDMRVFKNKTALNMHFSKNKNGGDINFRDFNDLAKQLDVPD